MNSDTPSTPSDNRGSPPQAATEIRDTLDYTDSGVNDLRPLTSDASIQSGDYISPAYAEFKHDQTEKKRLRTILLVITIILLLSGGIFTLVHKKTGQHALQSGKFDTTTISLNTIPQITTSAQAASLRVNGNLQADSSIILAPTAQPSSPTIGQIYFDKTTKQLRYYDGKSFNNLGEQITTITNNTFVTQGSTGPSVLLQTSSPGSTQTGNFNVSGTGTASVLQGTNSVITPSLDTDSGGTLSIGTVNAGAISIGQNGMTVSVNGALSVAQTTTLSGDLTVSALGNVAFQHGADYTNTAVTDDIDFGTGSLFRLNGASGQVITGIAGGTDGRVIRIVNASSSSALIANDSPNSQAGNRITTGTGGDITVPSGASVSLVYDSVDDVWRNVGVATTPGGGGSGSYVNLQASTPGTPDAGNFNITGTGKVGTLSVGGNGTVTGTLTATNLSGNGSAVTNVDAVTLQGHNTAYFNNASNLSSGTVASGLVTGSYTGITAVGTLASLSVTGNVTVGGTGAFTGTVSGANATANNQFVTLSQLNSAVGAVSTVSSLNTLTGALTIQGTSGQVTVTSNGTNTLTLAAGANVTLQGNTFNGANQLVQLDGTGKLPALNGSALTNLNASNLATGTVASGLISGAYTGITSVGTLTSLSVSGAATVNSLSVTTTAGVTGNLTVGGTGTFTGTVSGANATASNQFVTLSQLTGGLGGITPTLQNVYDNSSTPATIVLSSTNKGITLKDAASTVGGNLFAVQNNAGTATYLGVTTSGVNVAGTFAVIGSGSFTGRVSGADAVSSNEFVTLNQLNGAIGGVGSGVTTVGTLDGGTYSADGASISGTSIFLQSATGTHTGLVTTGTQTFGGNKTFSGNVAAATFSGDGSALTNLNASNLATGTVASGLVSGSYTGITAVGTLSSLGVTGNLTVGGTGAFTGTVSGANATASNQFVTLSQLNGAVAGNVTSLNTLIGALTIQGTSGDVTVSSNGTNTLTLDVGANVTLQGNTFNGVNQLVKLDGSGFLPALNGSALINLNASSLTTGTVASGLISGSYTGITAVGTLTSLTASGSIAFQKGTDFSTTGTSNDVNFGAGALFRLTGASAQTITGIAGGVDGRIITLVNAGSNAATIANNSGSSSAANRITTGTGASVSIAAGGSISLVYDAGSSLWRVVGTTAAAGTGINYVTLQGSTPGTADTGNFNISGTGIAATLQGSTSVLSPLFDAATAGTLNVGTTTATGVSISKSGATTTVNGTLTVSQDATFNGNISVAAGKYLSLTGGNTASRPASPTEGMVYYDTTTKKLIVYSNGKWQASSQGAILVAASNSSQADKDAADYVATGTNDQTVINSALTDADPAGSGRKTGKVVLLSGTFTISDAISVPNNTTLAGQGSASLIQFANLSGASKNMITNTTTSSGVGVTIRDLKLDGNKSVNTTGTDYGVYLNGIGNTSTQGALVTNLWITNVLTAGIATDSTFNTNLTANIIWNNGIGIDFASASNKIAITNSNIFGNTTYGVNINGGQYNVITGNEINTNASGGVFLTGGTSDDTVSANNIYNNGGNTTNEGIVMTNTADNLVASNHIIDSSCTSTCYAIDLTASNVNRTTLSNNTFNVTVTQSIHDLGTNTIYNGQTDGSGNYIIAPASGGTINLQAATNITGNLSVAGNLTVTNAGNVAFQKGTDFSTTGSSNNVSFGTGALFRLTGASAQTITGIAGGADGRVITIVNAASQGATLSNNSASSSAANRIITGTGNDITLAAGSSIGLVYDSTANFWRVVGSAASGTANSYVTLQGSTPGTADTGNFNISGTGIASLLQGSTSVTTPLLDTISAGALSVGTSTATSVSIGKSGSGTTVNGTLTVSQATTFNGSVSVSAGNSLTLVGGNTASRPASPAEGMLYYDTTTKHLITYSNGKWQASSQAAIIVAASNSSQADKDAADYVATGTSDQTVINSALTAADPAGSGRKTGKVILLAGTYSTSDVISVPNNTTLAGEGPSTLIQFANLSGASKNMITNTTTGGSGTNIVIRDLSLDGNDSVNTTGTDYGIYMNGVGNGTTTPGATIINDTVANFLNFGIYLSASYASNISGNTLYGNTTGMQITGNKNIVNNNNSFSNTSYGIILNGSLYGTLNGNTVYLNGNGGIFINGNASDNVVSGNNVYNNGGATNNEGIIISGSNDNLISSNHIIDQSCTTTCYAIDIQGSSSNRNTLSDNNFNSVTTETINDLGTNTIYSGQVDGSGNYVITPISGDSIKLQAATSVSGSLTVSGTLTVTNAGNVAFQRNTTDFTTTGSSNDVSLGTGALFRLNGASAQTITGISGGVDGRVITIVNAASQAATLSNNSGSSSAANRIISGTGSDVTLGAGASISLVYDSSASLWRVIGHASSGSTTSYVTLQGSTPGTADTGNFNISGTGIAANLQGTTSVKTALLDTVSAGALNIGTSTATSINIGGSSVTSTFTGTLVVGSGGNTITMTSTGIILAGNARNAKVYRLPAEYAGAVLDTGATGNNAGTMTSGYDQTNRMNFYKWTTTQVSNQSYDVVVQVPIPKDFDSWNTNPIQLTTYTSDTTNGTITVQVLKSSGSADSNFSSFQSATPGSTSTWATKSFTTLDSSGYTAGDYLTIRIRMQSPTSGDVRIGNLVLNYLSNK